MMMICLSRYASFYTSHLGKKYKYFYTICSSATERQRGYHTYVSYSYLLTTKARYENHAGYQMYIRHTKHPHGFYTQYR